MSCGTIFPKVEAPARGTVARLLRGLGQLVAFVAVLVVFGAGFWAISGADMSQLESLLPGGSEEELTEPTAESAMPMPAEAPSAVITLQSKAGTLRITDGGSGQLNLGHRGHHLRVSAEVSDTGVVLHTSRQPLVLVSAGETVTLACPEQRLQRASEGGSVTLKQVDCSDTLDVTVNIESPPDS